MTEPIVTKADCCYYCDDTAPDFAFRDGVLCNKTNKYRLYTETCQLFKRKKA